MSKHAPLPAAILMQTVYGPSFGKHWTLDLKCCQPSSISLSWTLHEGLFPELSTVGLSRNKSSLRFKVLASICPPASPKRNIRQAPDLVLCSFPLLSNVGFHIAAFSHRKREEKADACCRDTTWLSHQPDTSCPQAWVMMGIAITTAAGTTAGRRVWPVRHG